MNLRNFNNVFKVVIMLMIIGIVSIIFGFITDRSICIFYNVTGIPCPSCGMTRSFIQLFSGNIEGAFQMHPLFFTIFIIPFIIVKKYMRDIYLLISLFILVWVVRLVLYFPHTEPMVFYKKALIPYFYFHLH